MTLFFQIIHVIVCLLLILIVLLQSGKGADLAGAFGGGGSQTAFGARGTATFLSKLTTAAAVIFMATSFTLSLITSQDEDRSVMQDASAPASQESVPPESPAESPESPVPQSSENPATPAKEDVSGSQRSE